MSGRARFLRGGFTLIELLIVIAIIALLVGILLPALAEARKVGRKSICESNLRQFGIAVNNYATDFTDRISSFTWKINTVYTDWIGAAADPTAAAANQAVDILRRRAFRTDLTQIPTWIPHVMYTHLVLNDYLQQRLPEKMVVCPEDRQRLLWQESVANDPNGFFNLIPDVDRPPGNSPSEKRWPYSSSYQIVPSAYSPDRGTATQPTVSQSPVHYQFIVPPQGSTTILGLRKLSDVMFTSQKVLFHDQYSRHFDKRRTLYFGYVDARAPLLFFDASVRTYKTSDTERGHNPTLPPNNPTPTIYAYVPAPWEPRTRSGATLDTVLGYYRWTRNGLRGIDVHGDMDP